MTVIRPNSVSGITSITAQANEINFFRSNGALAGLQLNGVNFNTTTGVSTFNNLDVGGVLTYQDVTNVDSLGIGTFRTGINVSGGQLDVGSNIKLGNAGVITATSFVGSGANLTGIDAGVAGINTTGQSHLKLLYVNAGVVTFTNTSNPTPSATLPSGTGGHLYSFDNALNIVGGAGAGGGGLVFHEGGFTRWRISSGALHPHGTTYNNLGNSSNRVGNAYIQTSVDLVDNAEIRLGTGDDLKLYHDGTNSIIDNSTGVFVVKGDDFRIKSNSTNEDMIRTYVNGAVELYHNNVLKFQTGADRVNITGHVMVNSGYRLYIQNGFNDSHASINNIGGSNDSNLNFYVRNAGTESTALKIQKNGNVELPVDSQVLNLGASQDMQLYHNGTDSYILNATGNFRIGQYNNANLKFFTSNSTRWEINGSGHFLPDANNSFDIGSTSLRVRNIYTNDLNLSNEGSTNCVDNTWGDFTIQEGESDLFLINNRSGKKYKFNLTEVS